MSWRPILDGDDARRARAVIAEIATSPIELDDPSLMRGWAGVALLHGYLAREGDPEAPARAHEALARSIEALGALAQPSPWLGTGFTGIAWAMQHLRDVVEVDDDTLAHVDGMIAGLLSREPWPFPYELLEGLIGLGVYALERGDRAAVARVVEHLGRLAVRSPRGATWPDGAVHDLGVAHGITGAVAFLGVAGGGARDLLDDAIAWLSAAERTEVAPRFPMCEPLDVPRARWRNGWCYGDLPIACALLRAGHVEHALALAHATARGPIDDVAELDIAVCHGVAGRAHLFNRLAQKTGDAELLDAARRHLRATLDRLDATGLARHGFLTGRSGVALVLLAACSAVEPAWDRALLVG